MKTIFGQVFSGINTTEDGTPLDGIFGGESIENRIVLSPAKTGTTNTLLLWGREDVVNIYRGKK